MSEKCNRELGDFYFSALLKWQTWVVPKAATHGNYPAGGARRLATARGGRPRRPGSGAARRRRSPRPRDGSGPATRRHPGPASPLRKARRTERPPAANQARRVRRRTRPGCARRRNRPRRIRRQAQFAAAVQVQFDRRLRCDARLQVERDGLFDPPSCRGMLRAEAERAQAALSAVHRTESHASHPRRGVGVVQGKTGLDRGARGEHGGRRGFIRRRLAHHHLIQPYRAWLCPADAEHGLVMVRRHRD